MVMAITLLLVVVVGMVMVEVMVLMVVFEMHYRLFGSLCPIINKTQNIRYLNNPTLSMFEVLIVLVFEKVVALLFFVQFDTLNTKIDLHTHRPPLTPHHHHPPQTFRPLLGKVGYVE